MRNKILHSLRGVLQGGSSRGDEVRQGEVIRKANMACWWDVQQGWTRGNERREEIA